jgi:RecA/RadA recombinase
MADEKPNLREAGEKDAKARDQALQAAVKQIEQNFGQGALMKLGDQGSLKVEAISTGALPLDIALGVGGVPRGRIIEIFGPESSGKTTLVYHIIAEAQARGGVCAFIDTEHALDPVYARRIGVNTDELMISQPDYGEQALEIVDVLVRSGAVDVIAVDSVAALTPRVELEGQMGDSHVGLQARLMSQALRKLAGNLNRSNTICVFTNQIREKIGVMFGCFHYDARVVLADGSTEKIGKIVNQRMPVEVMSMDPETGEISPKRIVEYYNNGETDEWLQFEVAAAGGSGKRKFACTPNHLIFTPEEEKHAAEIEEGDEVLTAVKQYDLREDQMIPMHQLAAVHDAVYTDGGGRTVSDELIGQLDERAVAAWYCDDGSFSGSYERWGHGKAVIANTTLSRGDKERLAAKLEELEMGRPTVGDRYLTFSGERAQQFQEKIAPYVHPSLDYKLHPDLRGRFQWHPDTSDAHLNGTRLASRTGMKVVPMKVLRKYRKPATPRKRDRFDIQVEGNHTYLVDHVVVHNSPETQPGGRALKFYSSQRLDIRRIETLKEGTEAVGNRVRVKVVKNKVASPFRQAEFDIEYGVGISKEGGLLDMALEHDLIQKSGSFFSYGETRLGQGRNNTKEFLRDNPELAAELERKVHDKLGMGDEQEPRAEAEKPAEAAKGNAKPKAVEAAKKPEKKAA